MYGTSSCMGVYVPVSLGITSTDVKWGWREWRVGQSRNQYANGAHLWGEMSLIVFKEGALTPDEEIDL